MKEIGKIINGDCIEVMKTLPEKSIDLVVTSCPYNVGIKYDTHIDTMTMDEYWIWTKDWLSQVFRLLKDDGRFAINIPLEVNVRERGGRVFFVSEFYQVMKEVGFKFFGIVDLEEDSPHRSKTTAWGSWMSCSQPYIYNPKECVVLAYKNSPKKLQKGEPQWKGEVMDVEQEDGTFKKERELVFLNKDDEVKKSIKLVEEQKYLKNEKGQTISSYIIEEIKFSKLKNAIAITNIYEKHRLHTEGAGEGGPDGIKAIIYDLGGNILWEKDFGPWSKTFVGEIFLSDDGKNFAVSYKDGFEGSITPRIEFYNINGTIIKQYEFKDWYDFEAEVKGGNLVIKKAYRRFTEQPVDINIIFNFIGNKIR